MCRCTQGMTVIPGLWCLLCWHLFLLPERLLFPEGLVVWSLSFWGRPGEAGPLAHLDVPLHEHVVCWVAARQPRWRRSWWGCFLCRCGRWWRWWRACCRRWRGLDQDRLRCVGLDDQAHVGGDAQLLLQLRDGDPDLTILGRADQLRLDRVDRDRHRSFVCFPRVCSRWLVKSQTKKGIREKNLISRPILPWQKQAKNEMSQKFNVSLKNSLSQRGLTSLRVSLSTFSSFAFLAQVVALRLWTTTNIILSSLDVASFWHFLFLLKKKQNKTKYCSRPIKGFPDCWNLILVREWYNLIY